MPVGAGLGRRGPGLFDVRAGGRAAFIYGGARSVGPLLQRFGGGAEIPRSTTAQTERVLARGGRRR